MDKDMLRARFVDNLLVLIGQSDLTPEQISREIGCNKSYLSHICTKRRDPSFSMFLEICRYFQVPPGDFFDEKAGAVENRTIRNITDLLRQLSEEELAAIQYLLKKRVEASR